MTKEHAEKAAATSARVLRKSYAVIELASGECIALKLPLKIISQWDPSGEHDSTRTER